MKRWHLTLGLFGVAVVGAVLAPRLMRLVSAPSTPEANVPISEVATDRSEGHLVLRAGLDQSAVRPGVPAERFLVVHATAHAVPGAAPRHPVDLAVVLDASGSMSAERKIEYARHAARQLASSLQPGDSYALVVFRDDVRVVVPAADHQDVAAIHSAIDEIVEGGGTNLYDGIKEGGAEVLRALDAGEVGRVVVLSDGHANVGVVAPHKLADLARGMREQDITLSTIGLGLDFSEDTLASLSDIGGGTYAFVGDPVELSEVLSRELGAAASVVARGTTITLLLPDGIEPIALLGWEATRVNGGWRVYVGDIQAGQTVKIIARVRVRAAAGDQPVATVEAMYEDLISERDTVSSAEVHVTATTDEAAIRDSLDRERALEARRALGGQLADRSTRAYQRGDVARSRALLDESQAMLRREAEELDIPELKELQRSLQQFGYTMDDNAPTSSEGKRAIKSQKERYRDLSR